MRALLSYDGPPEPSVGASVWVMYLLLFGGIGLWLWRRNLAAGKVLPQGGLDFRIKQRFVPGGIFYPENKERVRPFRENYWVGLIMAAAGLLLFATALPAFFALFLLIWGLGLSGWMFFHSAPPSPSAPAWTNFQLDHLVVTDASDVRTVFVLGPRATITLSVSRVRQVFLAKAPPNPHRFFMTISEGGSGICLPLEFAGAGEYLAICRKEGATMAFADDSPAWFVEEMKRLPSWQPGYFAASNEPPKQTAVLVCATCGGSGNYAGGRNNQSCQFCGSSELRAPARK
jgi:hypothetical protein